jgi:hypothetical protein
MVPLDLQLDIFCLYPFIDILEPIIAVSIDEVAFREFLFGGRDDRALSPPDDFIYGGGSAALACLHGLTLLN